MPSSPILVCDPSRSLCWSYFCFAPSFCCFLAPSVPSVVYSDIFPLGMAWCGTPVQQQNIILERPTTMVLRCCGSKKGERTNHRRNVRKAMTQNGPCVRVCVCVYASSGASSSSSSGRRSQGGYILSPTDVLLLPPRPSEVRRFNGPRTHALSRIQGVLELIKGHNLIRECLGIRAETRTNQIPNQNLGV